jgi:electron transfer flavoprotein beta subunit
VKILVPVKQIIDPLIAVGLKSDGSGIDTASARMILNPYDETALEAALRLKEAGVASDVLAVSCGGHSSKDALRAAVSMGISDVLLLETERAITPLILARLLKEVVHQESCSLVLIGRLGMGTDSNQVAPMLAAMLDWTLLPFAEKMEFHQGRLTILSRGDEEDTTLSTDLPAVVSVEVMMTTPRVPKITDLLKAKKAAIRVKPVADFDVDLTVQTTIAELRVAPSRSRGEQVFDAKTLITQLRSKARVI